MKFKVGDIIKGKENKRYAVTDEDMKKAKVLEVNGSNMQIKVIEHSNFFVKGITYTVKNSTEYFELIESKKFTKSDLKDGDIVTRRDGKKGVVNMRDEKIIRLDDNDYFIYLFNYTEDLRNICAKFDIIKVERPTKYETVYERAEDEKKEILDKVEKEYLKAVIRPFRKRVKFIRKMENLTFPAEKELLQIQLNDDDIVLPYFEKNTMYKGMKLDEDYSLEELGI